MLTVLFNVWFYGLALAYSAVAIPLFSLIVIFCRPFVGGRRALRMFWFFIRLYGWIIVRVLTFPFIRVRYRDFNPTRAKGPFVFICNHRSSSDPFLLSQVPGVSVQVVNIWPFRLPVLGIYARWAGYLSVREMSFEAFKEAVGRRLAGNANVIAFPEGTRSVTRQVGPFHSALFRACLEFQPVIAPVCIMGSEDRPPKGTLWLRPGVIRMHRLPDIPPEVYRGMSPFVLKNFVRDQITRHLQEQEGER